MDALTVKNILKNQRLIPISDLTELPPLFVDDTITIHPIDDISVSGTLVRVIEVLDEAIRIKVMAEILNWHRSENMDEKCETWEEYRSKPAIETMSYNTYKDTDDLGHPQNLDHDAFKQLHTRFNELQRNPFSIEGELGHNRATTYKYLNHDGTPTASGKKLMGDTDNNDQIQSGEDPNEGNGAGPKISTKP